MGKTFTQTNKQNICQKLNCVYNNLIILIRSSVESIQLKRAGKFN